MQDDRVADAATTITADGTTIAEDQYTLAAGKTATLDSVSPVGFGPVAFETASSASGIFVRVTADLTVDDLAVTVDGLKTSLTAVLETLVAGKSPGDAITFDALATAIRDDASFALVRASSVFAFDTEGGTFTELRENDPAWTVPGNATLELRDVKITEAGT